MATSREIRVGLNEILDLNFEECMDLFETLFFSEDAPEDRGFLSDISYELLGTVPDGDTQVMLIRITADIEGVEYPDAVCDVCGKFEYVLRLDDDACGCCGAYHRQGFYGDCREDAERFDPEIMPEVNQLARYFCVDCFNNFG